MGISLLRLRTDEQLVALFRAGHDEAFRVIHDRYRQRLFAYTRQMLPGRQDAEDALQDVFVRAYSNLRASDRELALRAWLYRVAHNRCVDELRRPAPPPPEAMQFICAPMQDPIAQADQRESLRRLVADIRRLPGQQRSALLMRELGGMSYAELSGVLGVSVPAVKSLLVRARMALALAMEARETACAEIREELVLAHDRRVRPNATARRHMRDCPGCGQFRRELRGVSRQLAALSPAIGPVGVIAKLIGVGGGAGGGAAATGGAAAAGGAGGAFASAGALATGAGHVATLIAATVVAAGGAVEIQGTITQPAHPRIAHRASPPSVARPLRRQTPPAATAAAAYPPVVTAAAVIEAALIQAPAAAMVQTPAIVAAPPAAARAATPKQVAKREASQVSAALAGTPSVTTDNAPVLRRPGSGPWTAGARAGGTAGTETGAATAPPPAAGSSGSASAPASSATATSGSSTGTSTATSSPNGASASPTGSASSTQPAPAVGNTTGSSSSTGATGSGSATTAGR